MADHARLLATCALGFAMATAAAPAVVALTGPTPVKAAAESKLLIVVEAGTPATAPAARVRTSELCPVPPTMLQESAVPASAAPLPMVPRLFAQR